MTVLVVGASGATGRLVVELLVSRGEKVKAIVRDANRLPNRFKQNDQIQITQASLLDMTDQDLLEQVKGCDAVVSCLGHNLNFRGMFGQPRRLVTDAVRRLCDAVDRTASDNPVKFILMNTTGNQNKSAGETVSLAQALVIGLIRLLVPPHADNEDAAQYLQSSFEAGDTTVDWVVVRPDSLIDETSVTDYEIHSSPTRSAIFNAGKTSRINVANFMCELITDECTWIKWKRQMPVIYNIID